jgi:hypothetical protein
MSKFIKKITKKISTAASNLFNENSEFIKDIFYSLQSDKIEINEEKYNSEFAPLNKYYKKEPHSFNPILYIAVVSFNQKKGSIIEFTYPEKNELLEKNESSKSFFESLIISSDKQLDTAEKIFENINNQLTYLCMPDGAHSLTSDSQFFLIQNFAKILFGISSYRQLQVTQAMKEDEQENTRECVQKAMCIVSTLPLFGQMASKLSITMLAYFNQDSLKNKKIIEDLYNNYSNNYLSKIRVNEILESFSLKRLIYFSKDKIFSLIKLIMLEKKIIVYSHISNNICSFIFSFLSIFPGGSFFNLDNQGRAKTYYDCYSPYGLPLKFLNKNSVIYSIMTLYDVEKIEDKSILSYFIGTTNPLLLNYNKLEYDCVINLDEDKITFNKKLNANILHMGKKESNIMNKLYKECKFLNDININDNMDDNWMLDKEESNNMNIMASKVPKKGKKAARKSIYLETEEENLSLFEGSDDYIRNIIKNYITDFLSDISLAKYIIKSKHFNDDEILSKLKDILNEYNCNFISNWITKTNNFLFWNYEHASDLWKYSTHLKKGKKVKKLYENGDVYEGEFSQGKPNKSGKLDFTIKEKPYTYVGDFSYGIKEGKGNLFSVDNKFNYDGDWINDKYEGFGVLFDHGLKYSGDFQKGKFHGNGTLYKLNGDILEGEFFEGELKKGTITYKNGDIYEGELKNEEFNGNGIYKYKNGDVFKGQFLNGEKKFGNLEFTGNGGKYEGFFKKDKYNGEGILINKDGKEFKGIFKDGEFIKKLNTLKIEVDNELFIEGVNIQIKQNNDWEIADIKPDEKEKIKSPKKEENDDNKNKSPKKEENNDFDCDNNIENREKEENINVGKENDLNENEKQDYIKDNIINDSNDNIEMIGNNIKGNKINQEEIE